MTNPSVSTFRWRSATSHSPHCLKKNATSQARHWSRSDRAQQRALFKETVTKSKELIDTSTNATVQQEARATLAAGNPQGRILSPREVADSVRWLCGADAGSVHGQAIAVCGGEVTP